MACWLLSYTLANFTHGKPDGCQYSLVVMSPWSYMVSLMADVFDYCGSCLTMSYVLSCHMMSCHALSCLALPCHTVSHVMSCFTISLHVMPCNAMATSYQTMSWKQLAYLFLCDCSSQLHAIYSLGIMPPLQSLPTPWPWWMAPSTWTLSETREWGGRLWSVSYFTSGWQHWPLGYQPCHN